MDREADGEERRPKRRVQRHSPDRLLRQPIVARGVVTVSVERHKGRIMVRIESPDDER
jgi:hypothetical protein